MVIPRIHHLHIDGCTRRVTSRRRSSPVLPGVYVYTHAYSAWSRGPRISLIGSSAVTD
jgi:hypothetical protein